MPSKDESSSGDFPMLDEFIVGVSPGVLLRRKAEVKSILEQRATETIEIEAIKPTAANKALAKTWSASSPKVMFSTRLPQDLRETFAEVSRTSGYARIEDAVADAFFDFIVKHAEDAGRELTVVKPVASISLKRAVLEKELREAVQTYCMTKEKVDNPRMCWRGGERANAETVMWASFHRIKGIVMRNIDIPIDLKDVVSKVLGLKVEA